MSHKFLSWDKSLRAVEQKSEFVNQTNRRRNEAKAALSRIGLKTKSKFSNQE